MRKQSSGTRKLRNKEMHVDRTISDCAIRTDRELYKTMRKQSSGTEKPRNREMRTRNIALDYAMTTDRE